MSMERPGRDGTGYFRGYEAGEDYALVVDINGEIRNTSIVPLDYSDWYLVSVLPYGLMHELNVPAGQPAYLYGDRRLHVNSGRHAVRLFRVFSACHAGRCCCGGGKKSSRQSANRPRARYYPV